MKIEDYDYTSLAAPFSEFAREVGRGLVVSGVCMIAAASVAIYIAVCLLAAKG
jgi:hypothetical protein